MVEVFRTNVTEHRDARRLIDQIHQNFINYKANFDLQDCDNILRVKCFKGSIESSLLIELLEKQGFNAEILPDEVPILITRP